MIWLPIPAMIPPYAHPWHHSIPGRSARSFSHENFYFVLRANVFSSHHHHHHHLCTPFNNNHEGWLMMIIMGYDERDHKTDNKNLPPLKLLHVSTSSSSYFSLLWHPSRRNKWSGWCDHEENHHSRAHTRSDEMSYKRSLSRICRSPKRSCLIPGLDKNFEWASRSWSSSPFPFPSFRWDEKKKKKQVVILENSLTTKRMIQWIKNLPEHQLAPGLNCIGHQKTRWKPVDPGRGLITKSSSLPSGRPIHLIIIRIFHHRKIYLQSLSSSCVNLFSVKYLKGRKTHLHTTRWKGMMNIFCSLIHLLISSLSCATMMIIIQDHQKASFVINFYTIIIIIMIIHIMNNSSHDQKLTDCSRIYPLDLHVGITE